MEQKVTPEESPDIIEYKYMQVFTLRALGFTYKEIAEKTGYNGVYLRRLFMRGGKLHKPFLAFRTVAQQESVEEAQNVFFGSLPDVARTLATTAKMPYEPSGVMAGKVILEQTIGDPSKPSVQNNIQINNFQIPLERREVILNAFKNFGVIENETNNQHSNSEGNNNGQSTETTSV